MRLPWLNALKLPNFGRSKSRTKTAQAAKSKPQGFHAVSIAAGWPSCAAARELEGQSFLSGEAPLLPLPQCDQAACDCAYQHLGDRRDGPRRDAELGLPGLGFRPTTEERRERVERRVSKRPRGGEPAIDYFEHATGAYKLP